MKTTDTKGYFAYSILVTLMLLFMSLHTGMTLKRLTETKAELVRCKANK